MPDDSTISAEWLAAQKEVLRAKMAGRSRQGIAMLSRFIEVHARTAVVANALQFRSLLSEELGDLAGAREDLLTAIGIAVRPSYLRYTLLLSLGAIDEKLGKVDDAVSGYLCSLSSGLEDGRIAMGTAMSRLLALRSFEELAPADQQLVTRAAGLSWSIVGLPGEPNLADPGKTVAAIVAESSRPR